MYLCCLSSIPRVLGCRLPCIASKDILAAQLLLAPSRDYDEQRARRSLNVASSILVERRRCKGVVNVSSKGIFIEFLAKDDLESLHPWRSFTLPRLHPWTSLAFAMTDLHDWLVPDRLSWRRSPPAGLKPDVARVKVSKERTIASPSFRDPTIPPPITPTQRERGSLSPRQLGQRS